MAAGGIVGGTLGGIAGVVSLLLLKASGTSMEEVRYWQHKWRLDRDDSIREAIKVGLLFDFLIEIFYIIKLKIDTSRR